MYRLEISSYAGIVIVQASEFEFLAAVQAEVKEVITKYDDLVNSFPKHVPVTSSKPPAKRGRGRPVGSKNKK
jgi:hypothetical protein